MHVLSVGTNLLVGEAVEKFAHHREVFAQVAWPRRLGEGREERGVAIGRHERLEGREPRGVQPPRRFASERARRKVCKNQCQERREELCLDVTLGGVGETGTGRREGARRVCEVVGERFVRVNTTALREFSQSAGKYVVGLVDESSGNVEIRYGRGHT